MKTILVENGKYYVELQKPLDKAKPWQEMTSDTYKSVSNLFIGNIDLTDPMDILQYVTFVGSTASVVGSAQLGGTAVLQYEAHMDLNAMHAARRKPNSTPDITVLKTESPQGDDIPVDLWVDEAGRVRRIWFTASYDVKMTYRDGADTNHAKPHTSTSHSDVAFDLSLTHFDEPVSITVPPADQVAPPITGNVLPGSPGQN